MSLCTAVVDMAVAAVDMAVAAMVDTVVVVTADMVVVMADMAAVVVVVVATEAVDIKRLHIHCPSQPATLYKPKKPSFERCNQSYWTLSPYPL